MCSALGDDTRLDDARERRNFLIERVLVYGFYSIAALVTLLTLLLPVFLAYLIWRSGGLH